MSDLNQQHPMKAIRRVRDSIRRHGVVKAAARGAARAVWRATEPLVHDFDHPTLGELTAASGGICSDAGSFVSELLGGSAESRSLIEDFERTMSELASRYRSRRLVLPEESGITTESCKALYLAIRLHKPTLAVETGVANGRSTFVILSAMEANGTGRLTSIEISDNVGVLLDRNDTTRWDLRVMDPPLPGTFRSVVSDLTDIELFLHDSDHDYLWMKHEFETIVARMRRGGLILSDDVDKNHAFVELAQAAGATPRLLWAERKIFGGIRYAPGHETRS